jgi:hypothetical protein
MSLSISKHACLCVSLLTNTCKLMVFKQVKFVLGLLVTRASYLMAPPSYPYSFTNLLAMLTGFNTFLQTISCSMVEVYMFVDCI